MVVGGGARGCIQRENTWMNAEAKEKKRQEKWKNPIFKKGSRFATIDPSAGLCVCVRVRRRKPDPDRRTPSDWIPVLSSQPSRSPSFFLVHCRVFFGHSALGTVSLNLDECL